MKDKDMKADLRILMLEDTASDAELAEHELRKAGLHFISKCVKTYDAFVHALEEFRPDIILSDYKLPGFSGLDALKMVRETYPEIPVVMVTGALNDIEAVDLIHAGARDYILKDRLARLAPAVQRAISAEEGIRARKEAEKALRASELRYERAVNAANDGLWEWNMQTGEDYLSPRLKQLLGYQDQEQPNVRASFFDQIHPDDRAMATEALRAHLEERKPYNLEMRLCCKNGEYRWFLLRGQALWNKQGEPLSMAGFITDITRAKADEVRIRQLNRLYNALRQCNRAIVHCTSRQELFEEICRIAVQASDMKMAWVGLLGETGRQVNPVACCGEGVDYMENIQILMDVNSPFWRGPVASSIRGNQPVWCQDFLHDPTTANWHETGARFGWLSEASLPLRQNGVVIGMLALYAGEVNAFDGEVCELLIEMAADISFALDNFAHEAERKQAEARLAEQLDELYRWRDTTVNREMRAIELKHEVNELLKQAGQPVRYPSAEQSK